MIFFFNKVISLHQQDLVMKLEEKDGELSSEKKNALKRDKTIQGLTQVLKEKEKEVGIHTIVNSVFNFSCTKILLFIRTDHRVVS